MKKSSLFGHEYRETFKYATYVKLKPSLYRYFTD